MQTIAMNPPTVNVRNINAIGCNIVGRSVGCMVGFAEGDDVVGNDVVGKVVREVVGDAVVGEVVGDAVEGARE